MAQKIQLKMVFYLLCVLIGAVFHKLVLMSMMAFLGFSTYMISYLRYYQTEDAVPLSLNYTYFIMPILSTTIGIIIPLSGILEFKIGTKLTIVYSSLYLIFSSVIQYFSKNIILNLLAIFFFAVGFSLSVAISPKNACMYFPTRRGMVSGFLSFISAAFSSVLNIFGEKIIINPKSINPFRGYYIYEVAKNIKKYYLFQICCVGIGTIICISFIVAFNMRRMKFPNKKKFKKNKKRYDDLIINIENDKNKKEPLMPEENEEKNEEKKEQEKNKDEKNIENFEKDDKKIGLSGLEASMASASLNYSMNEVKAAMRSFRVWRLFLMNIFGAPLHNFIIITWRPISIYKNMPTDKIQNINSYTSIAQMITTPLFGFLSDKIPFRVMKIFLGIIECIVGFLFYFSFNNVFFFTILIVCNNFAYYGMFSLNEPHYMKVFGMKHIIEIAGIIGLANVIMGPVCSIFAFIIEQNFKDSLDIVYKYMFMISAALSSVDIFLSFFETDEPLFED